MKSVWHNKKKKHCIDQEKESWEEDVIESWDQLEVEPMPVPQKVSLGKMRLLKEDYY